jgi:hypothetical protein
LVLELLVQQTESLGSFSLKGLDPPVLLRQFVAEVLHLTVVCGLVDGESDAQNSRDRRQNAEEGPYCWTTWMKEFIAQRSLLLALRR